MAMYKKKPVIIEAHQITHGSASDVNNWPTWLQNAWRKSPHEVGALRPPENDVPEYNVVMCINTLEGVMNVSYGDWVIQGVQGELYPCKPDIFAKTYEPA